MDGLTVSERKRKELDGSIEIDEGPSQARQYERSQFSKDVQLLAQVERIWVMYNANHGEDLQFDEIKGYLDIIMKQ